MHNHDHDLIAALAEGVLDADETARATTDIGGCVECQSELDAQRVALSALSQVPNPGLSMAESARMRRGVADALGIEEAPSTSRQRRLPWAGLATAAVVLVAVVAAAPLLNLLSTSGDDSTSGPLAQTEARAELEDEVSTPDLAGGDFAAEAPAADAPAATEAPATTSAAATEEDGAAAGPKLLAFGEITEEDLSSLRDAYTSYRASGFSLSPGAPQFSDEQIEQLNSQLGTLELQDADSPLPICDVTLTDSWVYQQIGTGTLDDRLVLVFVGPFDDADAMVVLLDVETCEQLSPILDQ